MPETDPGVRAATGRLGRTELLVHAGAAGVGALVTVLLVGVTTAALVWRSAALASGLSLVVRALMLLIAVGRAEWRREGPSIRVYLRVGARFAVAFVLAGLATS
jgi:hypothetical protein